MVHVLHPQRKAFENGGFNWLLLIKLVPSRLTVALWSRLSYQSPKNKQLLWCYFKSAIKIHTILLTFCQIWCHKWVEFFLVHYNAFLILQGIYLRSGCLIKKVPVMPTSPTLNTYVIYMFFSFAAPSHDIMRSFPLRSPLAVDIISRILSCCSGCAERSFSS